MSNQRGGKWKPAAMRDNGLSDMKLRNFFRIASEIVEDEESKFYFEQLVDHITNGGNLTTDDPVAVRRILGV